MIIEKNCVPRSGRICPFRIYRTLSIVIAAAIVAYPIGVDLKNPHTIAIYMIFGIVVYVGSNIISRIIDILTEDRPPLLAGIFAGFLIFTIWALYSTLVGKILIVLSVTGVIFGIFYQLLGDSEKK